MIQPQYNGQLGFSITSPFKAVGRGVATAGKAVGHGAVVGAKATGRATVVGAKTVGKGALAVGKLALKPAEWLAHVAMTPVRNRVHTLRDRRANKIAWDKRKSRTPTPAERAEAASWTKSKLKSQGPHGQVLALFAGPPIRLREPDEYNARMGEVVTAATVTAAVPVLLALMNSILGKTAQSGEAPERIGADGKPMQAMPDKPGTVDMTPVQEAAQSAAEDAAADAGGGAGSGGAMIQLPGVGPVKRSYVLIGGAVLGGVLLLALLPRRRD